MLFGILEAQFLGQDIPLKPGSTFELGGVVSMPQVVGTTVDFSNKVEPSAASLKVAVQSQLAVYGLFPAGTPGELQLLLDSGQTYVWNNAFRAGTIKFTSGDNAEAEVTMNGGTPQELIGTPT